MIKCLVQQDDNLLLLLLSLFFCCCVLQLRYYYFCSVIKCDNNFSSIWRDHYLYTDLLFAFGPQFSCDCGLVIVFSQSSADIFKACIFFFQLSFRAKLTISDWRLVNILSGSAVFMSFFTSTVSDTKMSGSRRADEPRWAEGFLNKKTTDNLRV